MAEAICAKSYVSTGEVVLDLMVVLDGTPVVRGSVVKHKLETEEMVSNIIPVTYSVPQAVSTLFTLLQLFCLKGSVQNF